MKSAPNKMLEATPVRIAKDKRGLFIHFTGYIFRGHSMHIKKQTFIFLFAILLTGCGAMVPVVKMEDIPPEQRRAVNEVAIYNQNQLLGRKFKVMNIVEGISCKNKVWDHAATKSDAIFQARYWAQQMGADGITNLQCDHPRGATTTYNCWESVTCTAEAIKFE